MKRREKKNCEVCGEGNRRLLEYHHVIPRRDSRCREDNGNIAILCSNCHTRVHAGEVIIIGVYFTSGGIKALWFNEGEEPPLPYEDWLVKDNPLVLTLK
jgi:hypothetical protein